MTTVRDNTLPSLSSYGLLVRARPDAGLAGRQMDLLSAIGVMPRYYRCERLPNDTLETEIRLDAISRDHVDRLAARMRAMPLTRSVEVMEETAPLPC